MDLRYAVIPAAGLGTRMLPISRAIPKELLPIGSVPVFHYVLCEAARAGVETVVVVNAEWKTGLDNYLSLDDRLVDAVRGSDRDLLLDSLRSLRARLELVSVRQRGQFGLGHAVATAAPVVGDAAFAVLLPDEIILEEPRGALGALCAVADAGRGAISLLEVPREHVRRYGIAAVGGALPCPVLDLVEKPTPETAPSRYAIVGRYLFPAGFQRALKDLRPGAGGELQLTDAMRAHLREFPLLGVPVRGERFDTGNPESYRETWQAYCADPGRFERFSTCD